jgi:hypothetical protein
MSNRNSVMSNCFQMLYGVPPTNISKMARVDSICIKKYQRNTIKLRYLRVDGHPVACLATQLVQSCIYFGISACHPKDKFNKKVARELATSRIHKHHVEYRLTRYLNRHIPFNHLYGRTMNGMSGFCHIKEYEMLKDCFYAAYWRHA